MRQVNRDDTDAEALFYVIHGELAKLFELAENGFDLTRNKKHYLCWLYETNNIDAYNKLLDYYKHHS